MADPIRSGVLLIQDLAANTAHVAYTSPEGVVTLVKSFYVQNYSSNPCVFYFQARAGSVLIPLVTEPVESGETHEWQGWIALNPGHQLELYGTTNTRWWVSGAKLPTRELDTS